MQIGLMSLGDHLPDPHGGDYELGQSARHRSFVEQAVLAEELGFHSVHLGEHHCSDYILSSPPVVLAAIAERTHRLRLSTAVTLATHLDPVRIAEDYSTLDNLSDGRVEIVMGRGGFTLAYEVFGQSYEQSRPIYDESVVLVQKLLSEEKVDYDARFRAPLNGITVQPRPVQQPHPPIWVAAASDDSFDLAADRGFRAMVPTFFVPSENFVSGVARYRERYAAAGHDPGNARIATSSHTFVCRDSQDAKRLWRPYFGNYLNWLGGVLSSQPVAPQPRFDIDAMIDGPALCGSPAQVVDRLGALREELSMDLHLVGFDVGGLPEADLKASIELFASEVLPAFR
ncbi:LLM class flavin-dependent oxidoreductase [Myxococcota bacterium]|nr:LLM class flavin-dependent oxidoreductase [Myxococcota bacterium]